MNKPYIDVLKAYEHCEQEKPPAHIAIMLMSLQAALNRAYQDGYEAAILHLEKEYKNHE